MLTIELVDVLKGVFGFGSPNDDDKEGKVGVDLP